VHQQFGKGGIVGPFGSCFDSTLKLCFGERTFARTANRQKFARTAGAPPTLAFRRIVAHHTNGPTGNVPMSLCTNMIPNTRYTAENCQMKIIILHLSEMKIVLRNSISPLELEKSGISVLIFLPVVWIEKKW